MLESNGALVHEFHHAQLPWGSLAPAAGGALLLLVSILLCAKRQTAKAPTLIVDLEGKTCIDSDEKHAPGSQEKTGGGHAIHRQSVQSSSPLIASQSKDMELGSGRATSEEDLHRSARPSVQEEILECTGSVRDAVGLTSTSSNVSEEASTAVLACDSAAEVTTCISSLCSNQADKDAVFCPDEHEREREVSGQAELVHTQSLESSKHPASEPEPPTSPRPAHDDDVTTKSSQSPPGAKRHMSVPQSLTMKTQAPDYEVVSQEVKEKAKAARNRGATASEATYARLDVPPPGSGSIKSTSSPKSKQKASKLPSRASTRKKRHGSFSFSPRAIQSPPATVPASPLAPPAPPVPPPLPAAPVSSDSLSPSVTVTAETLEAGDTGVDAVSMSDSTYARVSTYAMVSEIGLAKQKESEDLAQVDPYATRKRVDPNESERLAREAQNSLRIETTTSGNDQYANPKREKLCAADSVGPCVYARPQKTSLTEMDLEPEGRKRRNSTGCMADVLSLRSDLSVKILPSHGETDSTYARPTLPEKTLNAFIEASPYASPVVSRERDNKEPDECDLSMAPSEGDESATPDITVEDPYAQPSLPFRTARSMCLDNSPPVSETETAAATRTSSGSSSKTDPNYSCPADILMAEEVPGAKRRESDGAVLRSAVQLTPTKGSGGTPRERIRSMESNYARPADALANSGAALPPSVNRRTSSSSLVSAASIQSNRRTSAATISLDRFSSSVQESEPLIEDPYACPADSVSAPGEKLLTEKENDPYAFPADIVNELKEQSVSSPKSSGHISRPADAIQVLDDLDSTLLEALDERDDSEECEPIS